MRHSSPTTTARLERIARALRGYAPREAERDPPFYEAAVAMVLRAAVGDRLEMLFIERARRDDDPWSGQVALPGGRRDAGDASLVDTAIRETREETEIDLRAQGEIIGVLDDLRPRTPVLPPVIVRPFVAVVSGELTVRQSDEVAGHFWAPLDAVLAPEATQPVEIVIRGVRERRPAILYEGRVIWGMTERILRQFDEVVASVRSDG